MVIEIAVWKMLLIFEFSFRKNPLITIYSRRETNIEFELFVYSNERILSSAVVRVFKLNVDIVL